MVGFVFIDVKRRHPIEGIHKIETLPYITTMVTKSKNKDLLDVIKKVVSAQLRPARIHRVDLESDLDHDGDPILRIKVIFEVENDRLDPKSVRGLARHLREPLERLAIEEFPTFSFATVKEDEAAAA